MPPRLRSPVPADAEGVLEIVVARDVADVGEPDFELADVHADWATPGLVLADDARVAEDGHSLAGYAIVLGDDAIVLVHPDAEGRGIGTALREWAEARAAERGTAVLRQFVSAAEPARALLSAAGYDPVERYFRMRADLSEVDGDGQRAATRAFDPERDLDAVHALVGEAFADVEGSRPQSLAEWRAKRVDKEGFDPALWRVLEDGEGIAGVAVNERWADGVGYVDQLAVARRARRRGHGRTLLLASFGAFRDAGLGAAVLSVHGRNESAADLYRSVGMAPVWEARRWEKELAGG
jgi:mycothiol synthase